MKIDGTEIQRLAGKTIIKRWGKEGNRSSEMEESETFAIVNKTEEVDLYIALVLLLNVIQTFLKFSLLLLSIHISLLLVKTTVPNLMQWRLSPFAFKSIFPCRIKRSVEIALSLLWMIKHIRWCLNINRLYYDD